MLYGAPGRTTNIHPPPPPAFFQVHVWRLSAMHNQPVGFLTPNLKLTTHKNGGYDRQFRCRLAGVEGKNGRKEVLAYCHGLSLF